MIQILLKEHNFFIDYLYNNYYTVVPVASWSLIIYIVGLIFLWVFIVWNVNIKKFNTDKILQLTSVIQGPIKNELTKFDYYYFKYKYNSARNTNYVKLFFIILLLLIALIELFINNDIFIYNNYILYFNSMLRGTILVSLLKILISLFTIAVIAYIDSNEYKINSATYVLMATIVFFAQVLVSASHLIILYIALEGLSLMLFILIAVPKTINSTEGGLKYFFQSSLASQFLLLGALIIFISSKSFQFDDISMILFEKPADSLMALGFNFILVILLFKIAAFPSHFWIPDIYSSIISISILNFLNVIVKATSFFMLYSIYTRFIITLYYNINWLIYVAALGSMIIGLLGTINVIQSTGSIRSFIAYTSINQVGFILLGLIPNSLGGYIASFIYLNIYLISLFLFIGILSTFKFKNRITEGLETLQDLNIIYNYSKYSSSYKLNLFILSISVWSMAGLPPLAGFFTKILLWKSLIAKLSVDIDQLTFLNKFVNRFAVTDNLHIFDTVFLTQFAIFISIIISLISFWYYFRLYKLLSITKSKQKTATSKTIEIDIHLIQNKFILLINIIAVYILLTFFMFFKVENGVISISCDYLSTILVEQMSYDLTRFEYSL